MLRLILAFWCVALCAAERGEAVKLWPQGAPGSPAGAKEVFTMSKVEKYAQWPGNYTVTHDPAIHVFLPPKAKATGMGIVVAPGGGHRQLVIDKEGWEIADWLNAHGIAAFVLKYRLAKAPDVKYTLAEDVYADAARAMRVVRSRAAEWGLDTARIGFMGFSAGGEVAGMIGTKFDAGKADATDAVERVSSRPDFNVLIYPWYRPGANKPEDKPLFPVPADAPPHFMICTDDDRSHVEPTVKYYLELEAQKIPTEMHIYAYGGHGYALRATKKAAPVMQWPEQFFDWMYERGLLVK